MDKEKKSNGVNKIIEYLKASIEEMKKVAWPTKKETYNYTLLVIFISLGVALFLGLLDIIFSKGLEYLIING
ncbi:MAG: Preprotein translocase, SecE subunit [Parcubacteria group bacterium GW2011_GWC2_42_12]|uniref:Protein translocase subunit SecE n=2 Tax=Candidatus Falkowiibacteriota TaxID=1752728 RepID=A0A1F5S9U3_9BACT|nr:MAG: Preprotein translocase, SecE subunit [Candidatus Falkowbacteria bacterium GW2011_GWA2_41_14]KKS35254.1 MAG: Preprotein translocase, SecE subunit [Parcubacteria group bacterium GW2011_GWC2_42_12]OGF23437.1 MAG: preprotein translocase subunit SecE [Candidatus Falkowbacteria bacterium RIFCSPHIGHO2_02_FULL_42_9]